jgi:hypothetical protein
MEQKWVGLASSKEMTEAELEAGGLLRREIEKAVRKQ